jgi:hypothetical protein
VLDGVRRAYALQVLYLMKAIERLGSDEALRMLEEAAERQGAIVAREMRRAMPAGLGPLDAGAWAYRRFMEDAGADVAEHKRNGASVTFAVRRCPFYEAFLDVGVDCGVFLNGICRNLTLPSIGSTLRHLDPGLRVEPLLTRESAEDLCLERVVLDAGIPRGTV